MPPYSKTHSEVIKYLNTSLINCSDTGLLLQNRHSCA
jgi:hypothetical protein